ncbi:MAG TPA: HEAT repeat domain-containing protein [Polyangiaceae bacterium]|nr:HEAT repeat domain-containing protein [Polyangiaceae bacterium]
MLEQRGVASPREVSEALARSQLHGGDVTTSLLQFSNIDEAALSAALSECYGLPPADVGVLPTPDDPERLLPREIAERYCCFPLSGAPGQLVVAVARPLDAGLKEELGFALGVQLFERVALEVRIRQAIALCYGGSLSEQDQQAIARLDGVADAAALEPARQPWPETELSELPRPPSEPPPPPVEARTDWEREWQSAESGAAPRPLAPKPAPRARRRGPFTLAMAREELARASERDQVLDAFFSFACQFFEYSALFAVHNAIAEGLNASGPGADPDAIQAVGVPLDLPSSLSEAAESCNVRITRLGREGIDRTLAADLRRQLEARVLILPVCLRGRCLLLLYGDNGASDVLEREVGEVIALAPDVANALGRIILQRKRASAARTAPIDAELSDALGAQRSAAATQVEAASARGEGSESAAPDFSLPSLPNKNRDRSRSNGRAKSSRPPAPELQHHPLVALDADAGEASFEPASLEPATLEQANQPATLEQPSESPAEIATPEPREPTPTTPFLLEHRPREAEQPLLPAARKEALIARPARPLVHKPRLPSVIVDDSAKEETAWSRAGMVTQPPQSARNPAARSAAEPADAATVRPGQRPRPPAPRAEPRPARRPEQPSSRSDTARAEPDPDLTPVSPLPTLQGPARPPGGATTSTARSAVTTRTAVGMAPRAPQPAENSTRKTALGLAPPTALPTQPVRPAEPPRPGGSRPAVPPPDATPIARETAPKPANKAGEPPRTTTLKGFARPVATPPQRISQPPAPGAQPAPLERRSAPAPSVQDAQPPATIAEPTAAPIEAPSVKPVPRVPTERPPDLVRSAPVAAAAPPAAAAEVAPPPAAPPALAAAAPSPEPALPFVTEPAPPPAAEPEATAPSDVSIEPPLSASTVGAAESPAPAAEAKPIEAAPASAAPAPAPISTRAAPASQRAARAAIPPPHAPSEPPPSTRSPSRPPSFPPLGNLSPSKTPSAPPAEPEIESLIELLCQGNAKAAQDLARLGAAGLPQLMARFPGPVVSERAGPSSRASECGPLLQALANIGSPAVPDITRSTEDRDARVRRWATLLLGEIPGPEACRAVVQRLADEEPRVHQAALDAARLLLSSSAANLFRKTLFEVAEAEDAPLTLRLRTLEHVARLRDSASVPRLIALLSLDTEPVVHKALWTLTVITRQDFGRDTQSWSDWWQTHQAKHRFQWLIEALDHRDPRLRKAAADELLIEARDSFGYAENLPDDERRAAQQRYQRWWETTGARRFGRLA